MKKIIAVVIAAALAIAMFAIPASAAEYVNVDDVTVVGSSFDDILWTANEGAGPLSALSAGVTDMHTWYSGFGPNGLTKSITSPLSGFETLGLYGWIGFEQEIAEFGYQINNDEPVFDIYNSTFAIDTEAEVKAAGGQYAKRYKVFVPLDKEGVFTFRVVAKLADGTIIKLNSSTNPNSNAEFMANNADANTLKAVGSVADFSSSAVIAESLDRVIWNFNAIGSRKVFNGYASEDGSFDAVNYGGISIGYAGWVAAKQEIAGFGYMINDKVVLLPGGATANGDGLEATIRSWGGDFANSYIQAFCVYVPIQDLYDTNTVCAVVQLADGTVVKLNPPTTDPDMINDTTVVLKCAAAPVQPSEGGLRDFSSEKGDALSYDQILVNGEQIANGNDAVIQAKQLVDGSDGSVNTIAMHGWFGNKNSKVESYGYMIDGGDPVYGDYKVETTQDVIDAGGDSRYTVPVDVSGLKDGKTHTLRVVAKLENGDIVILNRNENNKDRDVYVNYKAVLVEEPQPQTGDAAVALFAVILAAAMGAAVIVMKKRAF